MENIKCKICNNAEANKMYEVREMMFGFRDKFTYFQCSKCGCLQILEIPKDMSKYYPSNYYSFVPTQSNKLVKGIKEFPKKLRDNYAVFNKGIVGKYFYTKFPNKVLHCLSEVRVTKNSSILDIGCGNGEYIYGLSKIGFKNLLGADPFINSTIEYENGLKILKKTIHELEGKWDVIMFHHSFEHIPDQIKTLQIVSRLLQENGTCIIAIPTVSSYAWEHYRENWVQLDAPRHFFIHSVESIALLADKANLVLEKTIYNSSEFQFLGSEQYIKDIPLTDSHSYGTNLKNSIFSKEEITAYKQKAKELNLKNQGDAAVFYLKKKK